MEKSALKNILLGFTSRKEKLGLELFFIFKDDELNLAEPALEITKLEPKLLSDFIIQVEKELLLEDEENEYILCDLNQAEISEQREVYYISNTEIPIANNLFEKVKNGNYVSYSDHNHQLNQVWGIIMKIADSDGALYSFKKNYGMNIVKREGMHSVFWDSDALKLEEKNIFRVSKKFDCLLVSNKFIILDKQEFEKSFDYIDSVETKANTCIDYFISSKLLDDASKLYDLSKKRSFVKKIINIKADNPVFSKTPQQIVRFAKKYNLEISLSEDKNRLDLKNQREAKALLKVFNDDLLISELTKNMYESQGKHKVDLVSGSTVG